LKQSDLALERCQRVLDLASTAKGSGTIVSQADEEAAWLAAGEAFVLAERFEEAVNLLKRAQRQFPRSQRLNEALQKTNADLKKSKQKDYYKILGVPRDASESDIKRAYNKAARRWHPDKQRDESSKAEAVAKMQDLNAALTVLTDKKKRAQFDAGIDPEDPQAAAGNPFHGGGGPFGGHGGPFGGHGGGGFHFNFEDLFRQQQQQQRRGGGHGGGGGGYHQQYQRRQGGGQRFEDFFKFDL
jgi:DnaJ family protein C protein 3